MGYKQTANTPGSDLLGKFESFLDDNADDISPNLFSQLNDLMMEIDEEAENLENKSEELEKEASDLTDRVEELEKEVKELNDRL